MSYANQKEVKPDKSILPIGSYVNEKENEKFIDKFLVVESRNVHNSGQGVTICQENSGHYGPVSLGDFSKKLLSKIDGGV